MVPRERTLRKTIILAFATLSLAFASLVTDLIRVDAVPKAIATHPAVQLQSTDVAKVKIFDSI